MDHHHFKGNDIPHIKLDPNMSIEDLIKTYSESGFNGRKLVKEKFSWGIVAEKYYSYLVH